MSKLWHCRLGHISKGRIERQAKNDILPPLELSDLEQCRECIKEKVCKEDKMTKEAQEFYRLFTQTSVISFSVKSVDGYVSFITFTDDYSHYGYIYPIKERKDVLDKFKILKIEIVRSDRGGVLRSAYPKRMAE